MSNWGKNWVMFCSSPVRSFGALRYQAGLNAFAVALLIIRLGKTSGRVPSDGATNFKGSRLSLVGSSASWALFPRVSTPRPTLTT